MRVGSLRGSRREGAAGSGVDLVFASLESFRQEQAFRFDFRQFEGSAEVIGGDLGMVQARLEFTQHSVEQVILIQLFQVVNGGNGIQARLWSVKVCDHDGSVQ